MKFTSLPVRDQDRAKQFYATRLGCEIVSDRPYGDDGWRWIELRFPEGQTTLQFERRDDEEPATAPTLVLVDSALDTTVAAMKAAGVEVITEPQEAPWDTGARFAEFRDSEGNRIVITTR